MRSLLTNKKGASLSGWTEAALLVVLLMLMAAIVVSELNLKYNQNNDPSFGIDTTGSLNNYSSYQASLIESVQTGEASTSSISGLSLSSTWDMIKAGISVTVGFVTGTWIEKSIALAHLPAAVGTIMRILYILSIGFIAIKLLLKVKP